jgi:chromosome condensin MukBEF MukE localization factor
MAENVSDALRELATAVGSFGADVRAGMAEREAELRASILERTGIDTATSTIGSRIGSSRPLGPPAHRARVTAG